MDSFFGIGLPELILILVLAGIVMGPHRMRHVARTLGRLTAQLQAVSRQFARQLNAELDTLDGDDDIKGTMSDVRELQKELASLRNELGRASKSLIDDGKSAIGEGKDIVRQSTTPVKTNSPPADVSPATAADNAQENDAIESDSAIGSVAKRPLPNALEVPDDPG